MLVRNIGTAIKKRSRALKITQPHLAELAGISVNSLYKIERGADTPTLALVEPLAKVLGLEIKMEIKKMSL